MEAAMANVQESDVVSRDQALKEKMDGMVDAVKANGTKQELQVDGAAVKAQMGAIKSAASKKAAPKAPASNDARVLAITYMALAVAVVALVGSLGPMLKPDLYAGDRTGVSGALQSWSPLPQAGLLVLVLALLGVIFMLRKKKPTIPAPGAPLPAGVAVSGDGVLCDASGTPLTRGLKMVDGQIVIAATGQKLPSTLVLGPGGVLLHAATGRPVPHSCALGPHGGLLSSDGKPLPDSMAVGPNSCLVAADGTVLSPDLQPVPPGFVLSGCGQQLLRPNGKPVPRGVHVGPGFRLIKPTGELMPDGVKIGPCGTIICLDGSILASDGAPLPAGFTLSPDKTQILDPAGNAIEEGHSLGPNCTLISTKDSGLVTILGRHQLSPRQFALGPLGNLLHNGQPVPSGAAFNVKGQLIGADMTSVLYSP